MQVLQHSEGDCLGHVLRCIEPTQAHIDGVLGHCARVSKVWYAAATALRADGVWFAPYTQHAEAWASDISREVLWPKAGAAPLGALDTAAPLHVTAHMHMELWRDQKAFAERVLEGMAAHALSAQAQLAGVRALIDVLRERPPDEPTVDSSEFDYLSVVDAGVGVLLRALHGHPCVAVQSSALRALNAIRKHGRAQTRAHWSTAAALALRAMALHPDAAGVQEQGCRALANLSPLQVPVPGEACVVAVLAALAAGAQHYALRALLALLQTHTYAAVALAADAVLSTVEEHVVLLELGIRRQQTSWPAREKLRGSTQIVLSGLHLLTRVVKGDATRGRVHRERIAINPRFIVVRRAFICLSTLRVSPWDNFCSFQHEYPELARM